MNTLCEASNVGTLSGWLEKVALDMPGKQIGEAVADHRYRGEVACDDSGLLPPAHGSAPDRVSHYQSPRLDIAFTALPHDRFLCLQQWEGTVLEVNGHEFTARLSDSCRHGPDEEATLAIEDVSNDDRELLMPGAIFYLNLGYRICQSGQRVRGISLKFRRLPSWEADEILDARERARKRLERIARE